MTSASCWEMESPNALPRLTSMAITLKGSGVTAQTTAPCTQRPSETAWIFVFTPPCQHLNLKLSVVISAYLLTEIVFVERSRRGCSLTGAPNTAAWIHHLTTSHSALLTVVVMATVPREECLTRLSLAMVTATMITMHQNSLDLTHSSTAGISACQCGKCAEATLDVKTVLILQPVMRISLVLHGGEIQR